MLNEFPIWWEAREISMKWPKHTVNQPGATSGSNGEGPASGMLSPRPHLSMSSVREVCCDSTRTANPQVVTWATRKYGNFLKRCHWYLTHISFFFLCGNFSRCYYSIGKKTHPFLWWPKLQFCTTTGQIRNNEVCLPKAEKAASGFAGRWGQLDRRKPRDWGSPVSGWGPETRG